MVGGPGEREQYFPNCTILSSFAGKRRANGVCYIWNFFPAKLII